jgi:hypothetical protein
MLRVRIAYIYVYGCYAIYIVFIGGRGYAKGMVLIDLMSKYVC